MLHREFCAILLTSGILTAAIALPASAKDDERDDSPPKGFQYAAKMVCDRGPTTASADVPDTVINIHNPSSDKTVAVTKTLLVMQDQNETVSSPVGTVPGVTNPVLLPPDQGMALDCAGMVTEFGGQFATPKGTIPANLAGQFEGFLLIQTDRGQLDVTDVASLVSETIPNSGASVVTVREVHSVEDVEGRPHKPVAIITPPPR
jgi:hypothetical protein